MKIANVVTGDKAVAPSQRLLSLDALRGFDMFWIIGGASIVEGLAKSVPSRLLSGFVVQLKHVPWEGCHLLDLVWPLFMFIMGVAMPMTLARRTAAGTGKPWLYVHALRRAVVLFFLGMVLQGNLLKYDLSQLHPCYSVLHGIAAGYLIATVILLEFGPRLQAIITGLFLVIYWALLMFVSLPGHTAGDLTQNGNLATYIDHLVLGRFAYGANTWFLSYLGFTASVMLGALAGQWLCSERSARRKLLGLVAAGIGCLVLGLLWSCHFPIIKLLWTSSFVLFAGGWSILLLALFYLIVDVWKLRRWAFGFVVIGMNPLAAYMSTELFDFREIGTIFVGGLARFVGPWEPFVQSCAAFAIVWLILLWMYRTRTFVRI
jgi:predicted acyltransferase